MKTYPAMTEEYVWDKLDMQRGWVYYGWAVVNEPMAQFAGVKPINGFLKQESDKLIAQAKEAWAKE